MTDNEFKELENKLEFLMRETNKLQSKHWDETMRNFVLPLRLDEFKSEWEVIKK